VKISHGMALTIALSAVLCARADIETPPFKKLVYPGAEYKYYVLVGGNTIPTGINNSGTVTGYFPQIVPSDRTPIRGVPYFGFVDSNGAYGAFYAYYPFISGLSPDDLSLVPKDMPLYPTAINDSGTIVGVYAGAETGNTLGFSVSNIQSSFTVPWGYEVSILQYPDLFWVGSGTYPSGINNAGEVIGIWWSMTEDHDSIGGGFLLKNGVYSPLSYTPLAINNRGEILGQLSNGDIVIDTNGSIRDLGVLPFTPTGFNNSGVIVGGDYLDRNGILSQINLAGASGVQINAINDEGNFVGAANDSNGQFGFEATPEPFDGLPLAAGLLALAGHRFRNRRHAALARKRTSVRNRPHWLLFF
jgi:hypothetical protein